MNDAAIIAAWAAVIAALVGPIVSVVMAHQMMQKESKRQAVAQLFPKIMEDAQNFRSAFLRVHKYNAEMGQLTARLNEYSEGLSAQIYEQNWRTQLQGLFEMTVHEKQATLNRFTEASDSLRLLESVLNGDKLAIGLHFDARSERCGRAIEDLIGLPEVFTRSEIPAYDQCLKHSAELVFKIGRELKPLYESLASIESL